MASREVPSGLGNSVLAALRPSVSACAAVWHLRLPSLQTWHLTSEHREAGGRQARSLSAAPPAPGSGAPQGRKEQISALWSVTTDARSSQPHRDHSPREGGPETSPWAWPLSQPQFRPPSPTCFSNPSPNSAASPRRAPKPAPSSRERPPPCPSHPRVTPVCAQLVWLSG